MYSTELVRGTLKTLVLNLLSENARSYGYQLIREVKDRTEGKIVLTEGALYPLLHGLAVDGLVTVEEASIGNRVRKYYRLTDEGKRQTRQKTFELLEFMQTIARFIQSQKAQGEVAG